MRIIRSCFIIGALLAVLFFSGCATVTRGRTEQLSVLSEPTGASVRLSNGNTGVTPATFTVPRKGDVYVTVFMDGYETAGVVVPAKLSGTGTVGFLGNAVIGGVIGGGVDIYTGATLSHQPNPVVFKLVPKPAKAVAAAASPAAIAPAPAEPAKPAIATPLASAAPASTAAPVEPAKPVVADPPKSAAPPDTPPSNVPAAAPTQPENKAAIDSAPADPSKK